MSSNEKPGADVRGFSEAPSRFLRKPSAFDADNEDRITEIDHSAELRGRQPRDAEPKRSHNLTAFTAEHAAEKTGPVIIPFGLPGSGKTTFLATLFKLLTEARSLKSEVIIPERESVSNYAGQAMLNEWSDLLTVGRLFDATPAGEHHIRDVEMQVTPLVGQRRPLRFSIVEVSGEDLRKVVVQADSEPSLPQSVEALFTNRSVRPLLILMVHPERSGNDKMFDNLMLFLRQHVDPGRLKEMPMLVLIPNPRRAMAELHMRRPDLQMHKVLTPELCPEYLREFAPRTYAIFSNWTKSRRGIMPYHVGTIGRSERDGRERIMVYEDEHAKQVFKWIYTQFTGRKLGQSWYSSFLKLLDD